MSWCNLIVRGWLRVGRGWWMNWVGKVFWIGNWYCGEFCGGLSILDEGKEKASYDTKSNLENSRGEKKKAKKE